MTKVIVFERADGGMTVRRPYIGNQRDDETEEQFFARHVGYAKSPRPSFDKDGNPIVLPPKAVSTPIVVEEAKIPHSRAFPNVAARKYRNAWKLNDTGATVDMAKARDIHMDRIREVRNTELIVVDNDLKKAEDAGDGPEIARIRARRQTLRDIPQTFGLTAANTPEELDALWPVELAARAT